MTFRSGDMLFWRLARSHQKTHISTFSNSKTLLARRKLRYLVWQSTFSFINRFKQKEKDADLIQTFLNPLLPPSPPPSDSMKQQGFVCNTGFVRFHFHHVVPRVAKNALQMWFWIFWILIVTLEQHTRQNTMQSSKEIYYRPWEIHLLYEHWWNKTTLLSVLYGAGGGR